MNALDYNLQPVHGLLDAAGRLVEADTRLADLNARAGGEFGEPIAVPQIATIARLARRLDILISRAAVAADGEDELELWVRAEPQPEGIRLSITGWKLQAPWRPSARPDETAEEDEDQLPPPPPSEWRWECDAALRFTRIGPEANSAHGVDLEEAMGQPLTRLLSLAQDEDGGFPLLTALAEHTSFDHQRATLRNTTREVRISAEPILDAEGRFNGFNGVAHMVDLERVEAETAPVSSAVATPLPRDFGTRIDRALRTPLGRIIANAESIHLQSEGPLRHEYAEYAADIAHAGRHLLGLVDDLSDLAAIERPDFNVIFEAIDLADVARRAAGLLGVRASEQKVHLERPGLSESLPATGEFRRALQVLVNLIGNAIRYSPADSHVWIRAEREGNMVAVIVADQGKGIATDDQIRIFEKFERVDPGEPGGSGLGLYIARRLARAMGGDVTVDSAPGMGARFVFTLPARD